MKSASYVVAMIGICSVLASLVAIGLVCPVSNLLLTSCLISTASLSVLLLAILHYDPPID